VDHSSLNDIRDARGARVLQDNNLVWRKSCSAHGSCVEVANLPIGDVAVRDGKAPETSPVLVFSDDEWRSFIEGVKAGYFG
jgi:Domain of unknown function (DUF397)